MALPNFITKKTLAEKKINHTPVDLKKIAKKPTQVPGKNATLLKPTAQKQTEKVNISKKNLFIFIISLLFFLSGAGFYIYTFFFM